MAVHGREECRAQHRCTRVRRNHLKHSEQGRLCQAVQMLHIYLQMDVNVTTNENLSSEVGLAVYILQMRGLF